MREGAMKAFSGVVFLRLLAAVSLLGAGILPIQAQTAQKGSLKIVNQSANALNILIDGRRQGNVLPGRTTTVRGLAAKSSQVDLQLANGTSKFKRQVAISGGREALLNVPASTVSAPVAQKSGKPMPASKSATSGVASMPATTAPPTVTSTSRGSTPSVASRVATPSSATAKGPTTKPTAKASPTAKGATTAPS